MFSLLFSQNDPICHLGSKLKHHKYGKFIPPALIPKDLKAGGAYEIRVTEIISMCHFYFHLPDRYDDIVKIQELLRYETPLVYTLLALELNKFVYLAHVTNVNRNM